MPDERDKRGEQDERGEQGMTAEDAERTHMRGPAGKTEPPFRRMQDLRKIGREYQFICPVDSKPHKGSPPGQDPNLDPTFIANHDINDGAHFLG